MSVAHVSLNIRDKKQHRWSSLLFSKVCALPYNLLKSYHQPFISSSTTEKFRQLQNEFVLLSHHEDYLYPLKYIQVIFFKSLWFFPLFPQTRIIIIFNFQNFSVLWNYTNLSIVVASLNLHFQVIQTCYWKTEPSSTRYLLGFAVVARIQAGSAAAGRAAALVLAPLTGTAACCTEEQHAGLSWLAANCWYRRENPERANVAVSLKIAVRSIRMALPPALVGDLEGILAFGGNSHLLCFIS